MSNKGNCKKGNDAEYTCYYCCKIFDSIRLLKYHIKNCHADCFESLDKHNGLLKVEDCSICKWCNKNFSSFYKMRNHVKSKHKELVHLLPPLKRLRKNDYPCDDCSKSFSSIYKLRSHINKHKDHIDRLPPLKRNRGTTVTCQICLSGFSSKNKLKCHTVIKHPDRIDLLPPLEKTKGLFSCKYCDQKYPDKVSLQCHVELQHLNIYENRIKNRYKCPLCSFSCHGHVKLIYAHFQNEHNISVVINYLEFKGLEEYENWKSELERSTVSFFIRANRNNQSQYLKCNRSGFFSSRGLGVRSLKSQGSKKINGFCPASILCKLNNDTVSVRYVETHIGHQLDLKHLPLKKEDKHYYASKIEADLTFKEILSQVTTDPCEKPLERKDLVTMKDLRNIRRDMTKYRDHFSLRRDVLFYKPHGLSLPEYPAFSEDDFAIVIFSHERIDLLRSNNTVICIDKFEPTCKQNYQIFALVIGYKESKVMPSLCASFITSKSNETTLVTFFNFIAEQVDQKIKAEILMIGVEKYCYNAWIKVMGQPQHCIYSPWLVIQDWLKHLRQNGISQNIKQYSKHLFNLLWTDSKEYFKKLLNSSTEVPDPNLSDSVLSKYLKSGFTDTYDKWASCFTTAKVGTDIIFNFERAHNMLRYIQCVGYRGSNIKVFVNILFRYLKEDLVNNYSILHKKSKRQIRSHNQMLNMYINKNVYYFNNVWHIPTVQGCNVNYYCVKRNIANECHCNIPVCDDCNICIHSYVCTCTDNVLTSALCQHIHMISAINATINDTDEEDNHQCNYEYEVIILDGL